MKKRLLTLSLFLLALILCVSACSKKPLETDVNATAIEVVSGTVATECKVGDTLDFSNIKVKVTYSDSTTKEIGYADVKISAVDTATAGEKTVTVSYGELSTTFKVNVKAADAAVATLTSIKIVPGTVPSALYLGQTFDASGLQVEANYSDGTKKILTYAQVAASTVDTTAAGDKTFTVTYEGKTDSITVKIHSITSVKVATGTIASKLFVGETLDASEIKVLVTYSDGSSIIVSANEVTVGTLDTTTYGVKTVDVTYNGITIKHEVEVVGEISITLLAGSAPTSVRVGQTYDASKIKATLHYSGTTTDPKELTAADLTVSAIDTTTAGDKVLTVSYGALKATVNVKVVGVESLTLVTNSVSGEILKGAALDTSKISVSVKFTDGTTEVVGASALTLGSIDVNKAGEQKLTIKYLDKTIEHTVKVCTVSSIRVSGVANSVQSGKAIDISGMKVYGVYNDSKSTTVELTEGITTNIDALNADINSTEARTLTVSYNGAYGEFTTSMTIYATAPELVGIEITSYNAEVLLNNAYDKSSVVVYATYGNETTARIMVFTMTDVATNVAGDVTFTVTYEGKTATATVKVCEITSLDVTGIPLFVPSGEVIDLANMKVYGVYNDTAKTRVELTDGSITTNVEELNTTYLNSEDPRNLTVSYVGMYGTLSTTEIIDTTAPILESIAIQRYETEILLGESYGKEQVTVVATYGNGRSVTLDANAFSMTPVSTAVGGNVTFTVSYTEEGGVPKTAQATVKVCEITSLQIEGVANSVQSGNRIDISDMKVYGVYNNTAQTTVLLTDGYTTNIDLLNADVNGTTNRVLTVTYGSVVGTHNISVTAPALTGIQIVGFDRTIGLGGVYNKASVQILAIYGNGTTDPIENGFVVDDVATGTVGNTILTVTYQGHTANATVEIIGIASLQVSGINTKVNKGGVLVTDDVTVTVTFLDGTTRVVNKADGVTVSTPDTTTGGAKQLTVSYCGTQVPYSYFVKAVENFEIFSGLPHVIREGYAIDYSALKIKIFYNDGTEDIVTAASLGNAATYSGTAVGETVFSITYEGITKSRTLVEATLHQVHALNGTIPGSILAGNPLSYDNFRITLVYRYFEGGKEKEDIILIKLDDPKLVCLTPEESFDYRTPGDRIISFIYMPDYVNEFGIPYFMAQAKVVVVDVASIQIVPGSVNSSVKLNDTYDTESIKVQINYTDGTYKYVGKTELVSVSTIDTSSAGEKTLSVTYQGPNNTFTATYTVDVIDTGASVQGIIFGAMLPDTLIARDTYKNNFKDNDNLYVVGNDNPYVLYLNVAVLDSSNKLVDVNGQDVPTAVTVYDVTDGETLLTGDALEAMVSFNSAKNSYQFTDAALNRVFRLEVRPASNYIDAASVTVKHTVKVVDGYNIYDEKELNLLTNSYGDWTAEDLNENITSEGRLDQAEVALKFLRDNGITANPSDIHAIVLHRNMNIELDDLPDEYKYTYTKDGVTVTELIDCLEVYQRLVPTDQPFNFYGNYYSVFSYNLPCVVPKNVWNNVDDYSNSTLFSFRLDIRGYWGLDLNADAIDWPNSRQIANIQDVGFRDNDPNSNDQSANDRHMRGLTCITNKGVTTNVTNVNIEAFVVAMRAEGSNTSINLDQVKFYNCWQGQIFVWDDNGFQLDKWNGDSTPTNKYLPGAFGTKIDIKNSLLAKCGGPVILAQSNRTSEIANANNGVDVTVDDNSELYSYVTGQEAWFVAVNQTPMAAQIVALSQMVEMTSAAADRTDSYTSTEKINGVKTVNMVMVVMGVSIDPNKPEQYNGSFTQAGEKKMEMIKTTNPVKQPVPYSNTWVYNNVYMAHPSLCNAPIFQTSSGGICFTDAANGLIGVDWMNGGAMGAPDSSCFTGDYITLNMYGMGIMLEYYH